MIVAGDAPAPAPAPSAPSDSADAHHAARSGIAQVLTVLVQALVAATQVVFARLYGRAIYGAYQAALAVVDLAARGGAAGGDKAMLRYVAAYRAGADPDGVRRAIGTGLRLSLAVSGGLFAALFFGAGPLSRLLDAPALAPAFRILAPLPLLAGTLYILIQASLAARITRANFLVRGLFEPAILLVAGVSAWALGGGLYGLATAHIAAAALTLAVAIIVVSRVLRPGELRGLRRAPGIPGFARFALPLSVADVLNAVLQRADILMVTAYRGTDAAAIYAAAEFITRVIANIRYAFDSIVAGVISETLHLGQLDRLRYNLRLTTRWVFSVAAPLTVTVIVLRRELLGGLFGPAYVAGAATVMVLALVHFVNAALGLTGWVLVTAGRSRLTLLNNVLGVTFNIAAGLPLTAHYGVVGAALATLGGVSINQGAATIEVALVQGIHPFSRALLRPVAAAAIAFAVEAAIRTAVSSTAARIAVVMMAGVSTYLACLIAFGLPPEERRIADRALAWLRRRTPCRR